MAEGRAGASLQFSLGLSWSSSTSYFHKGHTHSLSPTLHCSLSPNGDSTICTDLFSTRTQTTLELALATASATAVRPSMLSICSQVKRCMKWCRRTTMTPPYDKPVRWRLGAYRMVLCMSTTNVLPARALTVDWLGVPMD